MRPLTYFVSLIAALLVSIPAIADDNTRASDPRQVYEAQQDALRRVGHSLARPVADMAFVDVSVVDMDTGQIVPGRTVIVSHGRIGSIGPSATTHVPAGARRINASGKFLMPGLADMHVHSHGIALSSKLFLANGVTAVREMSGRPEYLSWAAQSASGSILAPRIFTTGPITGGRTADAETVVLNTPDEARKEVDRQFRQGFRMLKPYTFLNAAAYAALMSEAKRRGMYVVGHVPYAVGTMGVIAAGQNEIAHIHSFHQDFFAGFSPDRVFAEYPIDHEFVSGIIPRLAASKTAVTTTLVVNQALSDSQNLDAYLDRPQMAYELSSAEAYMRSDRWSFKATWPRAYLETVYLPLLRDMIVRMQAANVPMVLGTDSGVTGLVHGFSTHRELDLLVAAGLTPYEALRMATTNAAALVGQEGVWGRVKQGMQADLLLVGGNPFGDIRHVHDIRGVMRAGQWLDEIDIANLRAQVRRELGYQPDMAANGSK